MNANERFGRFSHAMEESGKRQEVIIRAIQQLLDTPNATVRRVLDDHEARLRRLESTVFPQKNA